MNLDLLNNSLVKENLLKEIIYFEELESTNSYAKGNDLQDNTLIITSYQTNGIGRFKRPWKTNKGENLTFSLLKCFNLAIDEIHLINFYSSFILFSTLKNLLNGFENLEPTLKWPNDILLNRKKVAGFLLDVKDIKNDTKKFIIGIGVNVNQKEFPKDIICKATSLSIETKFESSLEELLIQFINNFYEHIELINYKEKLMSLWISNSKIKGKKINFKIVEDSVEQEATIIDIDNDGGLKVKFDDGKKSKFYSGEISLIYN